MAGTAIITCLNWITAWKRIVKIAFLLTPLEAPREPILDLLRAMPGTTLLPEPHVLTPLAYLGYYDKVYKAPYDHVLAAESQRLFIDHLPGREEDYAAACRAYAAALYTQAANGSDLVIDATPGLERLLTFIERIYPAASFLIWTQNPLVGLSHTPDTEIPRAINEMHAVAALAARRDFPVRRIAIEQFQANPGGVTQQIAAFLNIEPATSTATTSEQPDWAEELAGDPAQIERLRDILRQIPSEILDAYGYPAKAIWDDVSAVLGEEVPPVHAGMLRRIRLAAWTNARRTAQRPGPLNRLVRKARLACDVLLRD